MSEPIFFFDEADPAMQQAYEGARRTFKYFWRELSWERQRIVPCLDMAMVKYPFTDGPRTDGQPSHEQMWIGEFDFDGEMISGELLNSPNWLSSVGEGDSVSVPLAQLTDWMMTADGVAYGGFSVNQIRATMGSDERDSHDAAWGLDFCDPADVRLDLTWGDMPKAVPVSSLFSRGPANTSEHDGFKDHPMCANMLETIEAQLKSDASIVHYADEAGWTVLHREALAGNFGVVKLLVGYGADTAAKTGSGRTAAELARGIGWPEIADYLEGHSKK